MTKTEAVNKGAAADIIAEAAKKPDPAPKTQEPTESTQESTVSNNAEQLNPADLAAFRKWQEEQKNPQKPIDTTTDEAKKEAALIQQYGRGYVQAIRKGNDGKIMRNIFTATTWGLMQRDKDGKRMGWEKEVVTPPEIKGL